MYSSAKLPSGREAVEPMPIEQPKPFPQYIPSRGRKSHSSRGRDAAEDDNSCSSCSSSASSVAMDNILQSTMLRALLSFTKPATTPSPAEIIAQMRTTATADTKLEGDSSSSEATAQHKQTTQQTHPETPESGAHCSADSHSSRSPPPPPGTTPNLSYNPMTGHSPHKPRVVRRREIMGMSVLAYVPNHIEQRTSPDAISKVQEFTEASLEIAAQTIRSELLNSEIAELAVEAERAANSGQDSFAATPCLFQDDMDQIGNDGGGAASTSPLSVAAGSSKPSLVRRAASESAARTALVQQQRRASTRSEPPASSSNHNKLSVVELRDVGEVFPSFRQFHTHLRTHFFRSRVTQKQLIFQEPRVEEQEPGIVPARNGLLCRSAESRGILPMCTSQTTATPIPERKRLSNPIDEMQNNFLRTFSLDQWVPNRSFTISFDEDEHAVGDLISGHITKDVPSFRPKIVVPPGLETALAAKASNNRSATRLRPKLGNRNRSRNNKDRDIWQDKEKTSFEGSDPSITLSPVHPTLKDLGVEPVALFDAPDFGAVGADHSPSNSISTRSQAERLRLSRWRRLQDEEPSHNSLLDDEALALARASPGVDGGGKRAKGRARGNSIVGADDPNNLLLPDFVTPAKLKQIREFRKVPGPRETEAAGLLLPSNSISEGSPARPSSAYGNKKNRGQNNMHSSMQIPLLETVLDVSTSLTENGNTKDASTANICLPEFVMRDLDTGFIEGESAEDAGVPIVEAPQLKSSLSRDESIETISVAKSEQLSLIAALSFQNTRGDRATPPVGSNSIISASDSHLLTTPCSPISADPQEEATKLQEERSADARLQSPTQLYREKDSFVLLTPSVSSAKDLKSSRSLPVTPVMKKSPSSRKTPIESPKKSGPDGTGHFGWLHLSPSPSLHSDDDSHKSQMSHMSYGNKKKTIRRSTSTGALEDRASWKSFMRDYGEYHSGLSPESSFRAAMNMISRLSPRDSKQERALYVRSKENDDFMNNFLYCSKPSEEGGGPHVVDSLCAEPCDGANFTCGDADAEFCCANFVDEAMAMGLVEPRKHSTANLVKLSSTGVAASRGGGPDSWFDFANDRMDHLLDRWVGSDRSRAHHLINFQAPTLKKSRRQEKRKEQPPEHGESEPYGDKPHDEATDSGYGADTVDEKRFDDGIGLYDIEDPSNYQHSPERLATRYMSLMDDSDSSHYPLQHISKERHSHHTFSDKQFQFLYGMSRKSFEAKADAAHSFETNH